MGYLNSIVDAHYLDSQSDRFEWCRAWKKGNNGDWIKQKYTKDQNEIPALFPLMHDKRTGNLYNAYDPGDLPAFFTIAAIAIPIEVVLTISINIVRIALLYLNAIQDMYDYAYDRRASATFSANVIKKAGQDFTAAREKSLKLLKRCCDALSYGAALALAIAQALLLDNNPSERLALWTVIARIETLWNGEANNIQHTPVTFAMRLVKAFNQPGTLQESINRIKTMLHSNNFNQINHGFYILQSLQPQGKANNTQDGQEGDRKFDIRETFPTFEQFTASYTFDPKDHQK